MSEEQPLPKKRRRKRWWAFAGGGALVSAGAVIALGPAAHLVVDSLGDGARVWRLGRINIDDVSGSWIGDLRAGTIRIEDEEGVWLEAHDVALDWAPQDILFGTVRLNAASANSIAIARQPLLLERRPSTGTTFDVIISELHVEQLTLAEPVVGNASEFSADLALDLRDDDLMALDLTLRRLDSDEDRLTALYHSGESYALSLDLYSAPGGVIARALGVGEQGLRATAIGDGDTRSGNAHFEATAGTQQLLIGNTRWAPTEWAAQGQAQLDAIPALETLAARIGPSVTFNLAGGAEGAFEAHAETPFIAVDLEGTVDEKRELDGPARIVATTNSLSDIARESPFPLGAARLEGELRRARGTTAIRATFEAQQIDALGQRTQLRGPIETALTAERFTMSADLSAPAQTAPLFVNARLRTALSYDRRQRRFELRRTDLNSDAIALDAQGWTRGGDGEFAGDWRVRRLEALVSDMRGEASGRWRAFREGEAQARAWTIALDGQGARIAGAPEVIPQLLGATPRLDARMRYENGGITVSHARVDGAQLRAGATGRIVNGQANLALEASARGPLTVGGAEIGGAIDATGQLTGRIARPTLSMRGALTSFAAGGVIVEQPVINFTLAPRGGDYAGQVDVTGAASGQALVASSDISISNGAISLSALDAQWGELLAQGNAQFSSRGVNAQLDVNGAIDGLLPGMTGRFAGHAALTPETILLDAQIADALAGELRVRAATLRAQGPFDAIATTFDLRGGHLRQAPLAFAGTATLNLDEQSVRIEGRGTLADSPIYTRAPITADWSTGRTQASLNVAIGDGVVRAQWEERGRALNGIAQMEDAPLGPLAAIWGERATGGIDGRIAIASNGRGLTGDADIRLDDARVSGRQRTTLDMHIVGNLTPGRLTSTVDATSRGGLVAHFEADAPVETSAAPLRIALARERRGRARWSVRGPAESLWAATRLQDQLLEGALDGEGEIEFGAGYLSGDGHIEIVDGSFEDKLTGVRLVDLDARVALDERGVTIENFTASGPRGGRLTATGGSVNERQGSITVDVDNMRVADRPDARAVASGELTLAWDGLTSSLTGDLNIVEANIDIASNPQAGIPTVEVIEINRPGEIDEPMEEEERPRRNGSTTLNVNINAPGRVFTRGRGVDAEWALNMRLGGTSALPLVFGTARAVRGTLALSGQPFEIEDALIEFTGDPLDARINLTAVRDTADLSARIRLIGTARDPEIAFSSDPPLPEDEILPQVLFGRSVEDLSALEAAQLAASLAALSGRASLDLVDAARAAAGLDRFNVRQDEDGGFLVAGGVYLTRDVYVESRGQGWDRRQTLGMDSWPLVLITSFLGNGDQRVSLRWRRSDGQPGRSPYRAP
ncbi:MAG: translocation/assembly module TamB domain-containing protein [Hyphomonadaceae bacterium]